jgi:hypothetical protein
MKVDGIDLVDSGAFSNATITIVNEAQKNAMVQVAAGTVVYQTDAKVGLYTYNGKSWAIAGAVATVAGRTGDIVLTKADVGLDNVDNTADNTKQISTAVREALDLKVNTVAGRTGDVILTKADVGLGNVDNTTDIDKPISTATKMALDLKQNAILVNGKIGAQFMPDSVLGQLEYQGTFDFTNALPPATADNKGWYYISSNATAQNGYVIGDWSVSNGVTWDKIDNTDAVQSVAGRTGAIVLSAADISGLLQLASTTPLADGTATAGTATTAAKSDHVHPSDNTKLNIAGGVLTGTLTAPTLYDSGGNLRAIPQNAKTAAYTLIASDAGKHISTTAGGVTIPASVFAIGDTIIIYNNSAAAQTITCTAVTAYITGTNVVKTSVSLATRGMCSILFYAANSVALAGDIS